MRSESMNPEDIFHRASEITDPKKRNAFLDEACQGNEKLRSEVEALLSSDEQAGSFLKVPPIDPDITLDTSSEGLLGTNIGRYELIQVIGEGGMGLVYLAQQRQPVKRQVALKIIKPGMDSKEVIARFEAERQALAVLDHPNIARVFDAGTTDTGRPYFVMEYVKGLPITRYCDEHKLDIEQRLRLFKDICEAVHHAHQKGIIHRDLKPSNILVSVHGDRAVPKIIDFGIAKAMASTLTEKTVVTYQGQLLGTPEYMSPEQVDLAVQDVDTRSDVYSLGVVLYELLAGALPFERASLQKLSFAELQRTIREREPATPSHRLSSLGEEAKTIAASRMTKVVPLAKRLHRELEWIPLKAMRKDRCRRYKSASEMADDVQNYLNGNPLIAGPETAIYRVQKFVKKHAGSVATVLLVATAVVLGLIASTTMYFQAEDARKNETTERTRAETERGRAEEAEGVADHQRKVAEARAEDYRKTLYFNRIALAAASYEKEDIQQVRDLLGLCPADLRGWEWDHLNHISSRSRVTLKGHNSPVFALAIDPNGQWVVSGGTDGDIRVWNLMSQKELMRLVGHKDSIYTVAYSPDGSRIASASADETVMIWDVETGQQLMILQGHDDEVESASFSPDGRQIISASDDSTIKLWDAGTGREIRTLRGHDGWVYSAAFSPDGRKVVSASDDYTVRVWDPGVGTCLMVLRGHNDEVNCALFSNDGAHIVSGSDDGTIKVWDSLTGQEIKTIATGHDGPWRMAFNQTGDRLVSVGQTTNCQVWDCKTWSEEAKIVHKDRISAAVFAADEDYVVTSSFDTDLQIWDTIAKTEYTELPLHGLIPTRFAFDQNVQGQLWAVCHDGTGAFYHVRRWDTDSSCEDVVFNPYRWGNPVQISHDMKKVAAGNYDKSISIWSTIGSKKLANLAGHSNRNRCLSFSSDGRRIVSGNSDGTVRLWDIESPAEEMVLGRHRYAVTDVEFGPDDKFVCSASYDGTIRRWDARSGKQLMVLTSHGYNLTDISTSSDGGRIVSAGFRQNQSRIQVWDAATGTAIVDVRGHSGSVVSVAFSPDGKRFISSSNDGLVKVWDSDSGTAILSLSAPGRRVTDVTFSPDGKTIAACCRDSIIIWESERNSSNSAPRRIARLAHELVEELYELHNSYCAVIESLRADGTDNRDVCKLAIQIAETHKSRDAYRLIAECDDIVSSPDRDKAIYEDALQKAQTAFDLQPENRMTMITLGMAQYRAGRIEQAYASLSRAQELVSDVNMPPSAAVQAFIAMASHKLGREKEAQASMDVWYDAIKSQWDKSYFSGSSITEAEKLLTEGDSELSSVWTAIDSGDLDEAVGHIYRLRSSHPAQGGKGLKRAAKWLAQQYIAEYTNEMVEDRLRLAEIISDYQTAANLDANSAAILDTLAWLRSSYTQISKDELQKAVDDATMACELTSWQEHRYLTTLATTCSEVGDYDKAVEWQSRAIELLGQEEQGQLQSEYRRRLELYRSGNPYQAGSSWSFSSGELVAHWKMDTSEGGIIEDSSGHDLHGKLMGDTSVALDPERGNVLLLDGIGDHVDCGWDPAYDITGAITMAVWLKTTEEEAIQPIISNGSQGPWFVWHPARNRLQCRLSPKLQAYGTSKGLAHSVRLGDGKWHHVVLTYDGYATAFFVDGRLRGSRAGWGTVDPSGEPLYIGHGPWIPNSGWNGSVDDVRIYSYALDAGEVKMLYEGKEPPREKGADRLELEARKDKS